VLYGALVDRCAVCGGEEPVLLPFGVRECVFLRALLERCRRAREMREDIEPAGLGVVEDRDHCWEVGGLAGINGDEARQVPDVIEVERRGAAIVDGEIDPWIANAVVPAIQVVAFELAPGSERGRSLKREVSEGAERLECAQREVAAVPNR